MISVRFLVDSELSCNRLAFDEAGIKICGIQGVNLI